VKVEEVVFVGRLEGMRFVGERFAVPVVTSRIDEQLKKATEASASVAMESEASHARDAVAGADPDVGASAGNSVDTSHGRSEADAKLTAATPLDRINGRQ